MKVSRFFSFLALAGALVVSAPSFLSAAEPSSGRALKPGQYNPANESVDLFEGIKKGEIEVKMMQKDTAQGKLFIKNKSGKPLNVKLPEAFVGVNAQMGGMGGGMGGGGAQTTGGAAGGGAAGGGAGGNFFNVAAEKVGEVPFTSVCLEHGKPDPKSTMKYEIRPLESYTTNPEVRETIKLLGQGMLSQRGAQILAWHYNSKMSLEELAAKQLQRLGGSSVSYFDPQEVQEALRARAFITQKIQEAETNPAPVAVPKL